MVRFVDEPVEPVDLAHPRLSRLVAWPVKNRVGEAPAWDEAEHRLYWIDVRGPFVCRLDEAARSVRRWQLPQAVGAMTLLAPPTPAGAGTARVLVALTNSLQALDLASGTLDEVAHLAHERAGNRLNDGKTSVSGHWFVFGSMDDAPTDKQPSGALYVLGHRGELRQLHDGLVVANGIAFSPDGRWLYFSDSARGLVFRATWDETQGTMGAPHIVARLDEAAGRPDGACVDAAGGYWCAGVSAGVLHHLGAGGRQLDRIDVPCRAPTMPTFAPGAGGANGESAPGRMFLTSLVRATWPDAGPLDGALLSFDAPVAGAPSPRLRLA